LVDTIKPHYQVITLVIPPNWHPYDGLIPGDNGQQRFGDRVCSQAISTTPVSLVTSEANSNSDVSRQNYRMGLLIMGRTAGIYFLSGSRTNTVPAPDGPLVLKVSRAIAL
jgi:hypothetical protein